jgi:hypothetical protein
LDSGSNHLVSAKCESRMSIKKKKISIRYHSVLQKQTIYKKEENINKILLHFAKAD